MTRAVIHHEEVPAGVAYREWINASGGWLPLAIPGLQMIRLRPDGRL